MIRAATGCRTWLVAPHSFSFQYRNTALLFYCISASSSESGSLENGVSYRAANEVPNHEKLRFDQICMTRGMYWRHILLAAFFRAARRISARASRVVRPKVNCGNQSFVSETTRGEITSSRRMSLMVFFAKRAGRSDSRVLDYRMKSKQ